MLKTVFVVGAGASAEFNLGVGTAVANEIQGLLRSKVSIPHAWLQDRSDPFDQALCKLQDPADAIVQASETIRRGLPLSSSIDDFLHENRQNPLVVRLGKLSIAHCMLRQEERANWLQQLGSDAIEPRAEAFKGLRGTWLELLFRILKRTHSASEAREAFSSVSFIIFNYDRCIEQFLYTALADAFCLTPTEAKSVGDSIQIEHVYGYLGPLPIQQPDNGLIFAAPRCDLLSVAKGIKTYTEEVSGTSRAIIEAMLAEADQLVFLGYAFHQQGLQLLFPEQPTPREYKRVFWTQHDVHQAVASRFAALFPRSSQYPIANKCGPAIAEWQFDLLKD